MGLGCWDDFGVDGSSSLTLTPMDFSSSSEAWLMVWWA